MKKWLWVPLTFSAALLLWLATFLTAGLSAARTEGELADTLQLLLPGATAFTREAGDGHTVRALYRSEAGTVAEVETAGYVHNVRLLVAVDRTGSVTGLAVREAHETPGLGSRILHSADFLAQFLATDGEAAYEPITGATVSSRAIQRCVSAAVAAATGRDVTTEATGEVVP